MSRSACPRGEETDDKQNGQTHPGKQHAQCRRGGRAFIQELDREPVSREQQARLKKLLVERLSLRGRCRVVGVRLGGLLNYLVSRDEALPDQLQADVAQANHAVLRQRLEVEADELLSCVSNKKNKPWWWLARDVKTKQVLAFALGERRKRRVRNRWNVIANTQTEAGLQLQAELDTAR